MIYSMTGFGRGEYRDAGMRMSVEMKGVNHRYLDVGIRLPRKLNAFESRMRSVVKDYIRRGKIDVFVQYEDLTSKGMGVCYNREAAASYLAYLREMSEDFGLENDVRGVSRLASLPGIFSADDWSEPDPAVEEALISALKEACESFCRARSAEGEALALDLSGKLDQMSTYVGVIEERCPLILKEYRERLYARVEELLGDTRIEESRLLTEVAIFADKVAVDEELVRLKAHVASMKRELAASRADGKKLDFIAQEMNREANTTLSKANDLELSGTAIELKTLIEKIREQIQNIE